MPWGHGASLGSDMNARQLCLYCVRGESENGIVAENIRCDVFRLTINKFGFELAF
jgi:hypothetical protein